MKGDILFGLTVVLFATLVNANDLDIIDNHEASSVENVEPIAKIICNSHNEEQVISRISTVVALVEYLKNVPKDHELSSCKERYLESAERLKVVIVTGNENVCSDMKVSLIESFHADFVAAGKRDTASQDLQAPKILIRFFMHFVYEVATLCQRSIVYNLKHDLDDHISLDEMIESEDSYLGKILRVVKAKLPSLYSVERFDDIVLVWDLIQSHLNIELTGKYVDQYTGEPVKMFMKAKNIANLKDLKRLCASKLRPIYGRVILPVVRLSNIGYEVIESDVQHQLDETRSSDSIKNWYLATQLCEAILPIKFVQDDSMPSNRVMIVPQEQAMKLEGYIDAVADGPTDPVIYEPKMNSFEGLERLTLVDKNHELVRNTKHGLSTRRISTRRVFSRVFRDIRRNLNFLSGKLLVAQKDKSPIDLSEIVAKADLSDENARKMDSNIRNKWLRFITRFRKNRYVNLTKSHRHVLTSPSDAEKEGAMGKILKYGLYTFVGLFAFAVAVVVVGSSPFILIIALIAITIAVLTADAPPPELRFEANSVLLRPN